MKRSVILSLLLTVISFGIVVAQQSGSSSGGSASGGTMSGGNMSGGDMSGGVGNREISGKAAGGMPIEAPVQALSQSGGAMSGGAMSGGAMSGGAMSGGAMSSGSMARGSLADLVSQTPNLSTLLTAIETAGLSEELASNGPFTVFAPTNDAFAALPAEDLAALLNDPEALAGVLQNHLVDGNYTLSELTKLPTVLTLSGWEVAASSEGERATVGDAAVLERDLQASNGRVHLIDTVLMSE